MRKHPSTMMAILAVLMLILAACSGGGMKPRASAAEAQPAGSSPRSQAAPSERDRPGCLRRASGGMRDY